MSKAIVLVGHGGVPSDFPRDSLLELKRLEGMRRARKAPPSSRELELDQKIRCWPRTAESDPYRQGIEQLGQALRRKVNVPVELAYNEFCAPTVDQAVAELVQSGVNHITIVPSMLTPGGSHSEIEIPELIEDCRVQWPMVEFVYAWPIQVDSLAELLAQHLGGF